MTKREKPFDAVQLMRQIRDKLSEQMKDMRFEEQKCYMKERLATGKPTQASPSESGTQAA